MFDFLIAFFFWLTNWLEEKEKEKKNKPKGK